MTQGYIVAEKRTNSRVTVNYVVSYRRQDLTDYDITQVKNISQRGLLLISSKQFSKGDILKMKIKLPFVSHKAEITGEVISSKKIAKKTAKGIANIYETRIKFGYLEQETFKQISKLVEKEGER